MQTHSIIKQPGVVVSMSTLVVVLIAGLSGACASGTDSTRGAALTDTIDPDQITAKGHRWVRTGDGRIVEYAVIGSIRPDARTVVSAYFATTRVNPTWTKAFEDLNIRMINVSLPGLGLSSLHPGRVVADWPKTDLNPILEAEEIEDFWIYGVSYGTIHAMAAAQHYGPSRVRGMGLRVPFFGLPLSEELGLPNGQPVFPTTDEIRRNTPEVRRWRLALNEVLGSSQTENESGIEYPDELKSMMERINSDGVRFHAAMARDYPDELKVLERSMLTWSANSMLYGMAKDVALDLPGLDPRNVELSGDRVVVWYAADDEDTHPSHGEWLAKHYKANTRVFEGYGHFGGASIDHPQFLAELVGSR